MDQLPPLAEGFVRIALLMEEGQLPTPGEVAKATGLQAEQIGHILVDGFQVIVDVESALGNDVRERLEKIGPTQLVDMHKVKKAPLEWQWLRLAIGRNRGLTIGHLRKLLDRSKIRPIGKIHLNNTYTVVGFPTNRINDAIEFFTKTKVNGINVKPAIPEKMGGNPAYEGGNKG